MTRIGDSDSGFLLKKCGMSLINIPHYILPLIAVKIIYLPYKDISSLSAVQMFLLSTVRSST